MLGRLQESTDILLRTLFFNTSEATPIFLWSHQENQDSHQLEIEIADEV